jgi:hypothetical protein
LDFKGRKCSSYNCGAKRKRSWRRKISARRKVEYYQDNCLYYPSLDFKAYEGEQAALKVEESSIASDFPAIYDDRVEGIE